MSMRNYVTRGDKYVTHAEFEFVTMMGHLPVVQARRKEKTDQTMQYYLFIAPEKRKKIPEKG
jgi:hypothetical protein